MRVTGCQLGTHQLGDDPVQTLLEEPKVWVSSRRCCGLAHSDDGLVDALRLYADHRGGGGGGVSSCCCRLVVKWD